jgi:hypothetical protein
MASKLDHWDLGELAMVLKEFLVHHHHFRRPPRSRSKPRPRSRSLVVNSRVCCYYWPESRPASGVADYRPRMNPKAENEITFLMGTSLVKLMTSSVEMTLKMTLEAAAGLVHLMKSYFDMDW